MRIISQNGKFDLPYENLAIFFEYENVIARFENERYLLGQYSSEAKAIKAMEMLRGTYLSRMELDGGYDAVNGCYVQPNFWVLPKVFQFPQDDEIEV